MDSLEIEAGLEKPEGAATGIVDDLEIFVPLGGLIDIDKEKDRIVKEIQRIEQMLEGLRKKLKNKNFIDRAPGEVVEKERNKQADFMDKVKKLRENIKALEG